MAQVGALLASRQFGLAAYCPAMSGCHNAHSSRLRNTMSGHGIDPNAGPETIEDLIADREKTWAGFTSAATGVIIFMIVFLIGMAVFLL
jgi:hypothetical protein